MTKTIKITAEEIMENEGDISDIEISEADIAKAIDKLKRNSAAGPDGIPAIFLINTSESIKLPLKIILRKSLDECQMTKLGQELKLCDTSLFIKQGIIIHPAARTE